MFGSVERPTAETTGMALSETVLLDIGEYQM